MQITITNGTLTNIQETLSPSQGYVLPSSVTVTGASSSYSDSTGLLQLTSPTSSMSVSASGVVAVVPSISIGNLSLDKAYFGNLEVMKIYYGNTLLWEAPAPSVDPVLANNSWDTIKAVCQAGNAADYWALGDTKTIAVSGVGDVPHAIVDMTPGRYEYANSAGTYTNVVFQAVPTIGNYAFNSSSNVSPNGDTAYNGWDYSTLRTSMNSGTIYGMYDSDFVALLVQVKTMAAYSGKTNTLVYSSDKLFIPAAREVKANYTSVQSCELNITQYGYYALNSDANANRIKYPYNSASATYWWLRSPRSDNTSYVHYVHNNGSMVGFSADINGLGVAPCFAF